MIKHQVISFDSMRHLYMWTKHPNAVRLGYVVGICALGVMVWGMLREYSAIIGILRRMELSLLGLAFGLNFVSLGIIALGWGQIFRWYGYSFSLIQLFRVYFFTGIVRYFPGGVWHFGGRLAWLDYSDIPFKVSLRMVGIEQMLSLWIGLIFGIFLTFYESLFTWENRVLLGSGCLALLMMTGVVLHRTQAYRGLKAAGLILIYLVFWFCYGTSLYILIIAMGFSIKMVSFTSVSGYSALSWVIGYVIVFVPGGLGLREIILAVMLSTFLPYPASVSIALLTRVLSILSELVWVLGMWFTHLTTRKYY